MRQEAYFMRKTYRRKRHTVSLLHAHLVFTTKYRKRVITSRVFNILRAAMRKSASNLEVDIIAIEADRDHIHVMICYLPHLALSKIVQHLKGASSRRLRERRLPEVLKRLWGAAFWAPSYCVISCGGAPLDVVKAYVDGQVSDHHRARRDRADAKRHL